MATKGEPPGGSLGGPSVKVRMQKLNNQNNLAEQELSHKLNMYSRAKSASIHNLDRQRMDVKDFMKNLRHCESDGLPSSKLYIPKEDYRRHSELTNIPPQSAPSGHREASPHFRTFSRHLVSGDSKRNTTTTNSKFMNEVSFRELMTKYGKHRSLAEYLQKETKTNARATEKETILKVTENHNTVEFPVIQNDARYPAQWAAKREQTVTWSTASRLDVPTDQPRRKSLDERISEFYDKVDLMKKKYAADTKSATTSESDQSQGQMDSIKNGESEAEHLVK